MAEACSEALQRRARMTPFLAAVHLPEPIDALAETLSPPLLNQPWSHDERRAAFDNLAAEQLLVNGTKINAQSWYQPGQLAALVDFLRLADVVWCRSHAELTRIGRLTGYRPPRFTIGAPPDPGVPAPAYRAAGANEIVVWAPLLDAAQLGVLLVGLEELHAPLTVVCRDGHAPRSRARFARVDEGPSTLARAAVIVDAETAEPGTALALARFGRPIVVAASSGAHEFLDGGLSYEPSSYRSVTFAVSSALAAGVPTFRPNAAIGTPSNAMRDLVRDGPLVSILIPTYNRARQLRHALASTHAQTYGNVEIVVVNDGGEPVDEIVAAWPHARLVNLPENQGTSAAVNAAFRESRGEYICFLADDDVMFPDHASVLVEALERTGGKVAHADALTAYVLARDDSYAIEGLSVNMPRAMDLGTQLHSNVIGGTTVMMRRSAFVSDEDPLDMSIPFNRDYEAWLRLALRYDWVHVPRVTSAYSLRNDNSNMITKNPERHIEAFRLIFQKHPVEGRPVIEAARRATIERARSGAINPPPPPMTFSPIVWPPTSQDATPGADR